MTTKSSRTIKRLLALAALATLTGCYTTTISSGKPAARASIEHDAKWHSGLVWGIAELSGPYNLQAICPQGWAEIETETSFLNGLVEGLTGGIYSPQSVTVRCASGGAAATEAMPAEDDATPSGAEPGLDEEGAPAEGLEEGDAVPEAR